MQDAFVVHVEDGQCDLCCPLYYFLLLDFPPPVLLLLLSGELVEVASRAVLHDDIQPLPLLDRLLVADDVDVLELPEQSHLIVDVLAGGLTFFVTQLYLFDHVVLVLAVVAS